MTTESASALVAVDFETFYDADYSLRKLSVHRYVTDPRFNAYLVAVYGEGIQYVGAPSGFDWRRLDGKTLCAHNASFDEAVFRRLLALGVIKDPPTGIQWVCTADLAAWLGVKRDLATAMKELFGEELSKSVRDRMKGRSPEELLSDPDVLLYGGKDALSCFRLASKYLSSWPAEERRVSRLNREAGFRGITLDLPLVLQGIATLEPRLAEAQSRLPWVAQGEKPLSPNAAKSQAARDGIPIPASFAKDNECFLSWLEEYRERFPWVSAMGEYRSVNTLLGRVCNLRDGRDPSTGRFPYGLKYFGASTGRFSGGSGDSGGKFNMQNMPSKIMHGVNVRPMFIAPPGHTFLIADYNQIEARYLLWLAGDLEALAPLWRGVSVYQSQAEVLGLAAAGSNIKETDKRLYKYVKACTLGLGYQTAAPKFRVFAKTYGVILTDEEAEKAVTEWRSRNWRIVKVWRDHHDALALSARRQDRTHQVELRSGRILTYWEPRTNGREISAYQTLGDHRAYLYGGKLTENEVQASCRDILVHSWLACADAGYLPVLNVHDELVFEIPLGSEEAASSEIVRLMTTSTPWTAGLPLGVDVKVSPFYIKD